MSNSNQTRIDEVSEHYESAKKAEFAGKCLFWIIAVISIYMPYTSALGTSYKSALQIVFIVFVLINFAVSILLRLQLVPKAELIRRRQMLSDAFGTKLTHDKTSLYYNNNYPPGFKRLGANAMENSLFSKEVAAKMLCKSRFITGSYIIGWSLASAISHNNLEVWAAATQVVFSIDILFQWLSLEVLRYRQEGTYEQLHAYFLHELDDASPRGKATILDAFAAYEAAKASAGLLLSSKIFYKLNPSLTEKWEQIRKELKMD